MSGQRTAVDPRNESLQNSEVVDHEEDATIIADENARCHWNGVEFPDGDSICAEGKVYECHLGKWMKMPGTC